MILPILVEISVKRPLSTAARRDSKSIDFCLNQQLRDYISTHDAMQPANLNLLGQTPEVRARRSMRPSHNTRTATNPISTGVRRLRSEGTCNFRQQRYDRGDLPSALVPHHRCIRGVCYPVSYGVLILTRILYRVVDRCVITTLILLSLLRRDRRGCHHRTSSSAQPQSSSKKKTELEYPNTSRSVTEANKCGGK